jgi:seryl-tRNA synthetase
LPCAQGKLHYTLPASKPLTHDDLLWRIGGYEPTRGAAIAGHRGYFLTNAGVLLNQAIINYAIAFLSARDYQILQPPFMMNKNVMASIAQLEDFDEQLYKVSGKTGDADTDGSSEKYLIATSEQPICAYHQGDWLDPKADLPLRYAGISTCFRKEAGSSGKDIRGIFRVHQFEKVEQFCLVADDFEVSQAEQQRMLKAAQDFYESLGIGYRVVCLVSGELNDAAVKKYDLEGWFPGQNTYRELVSCSNCTDFQARGVGVRCGSKSTTVKGDLTARASYVHMLNATLCATGRGICCILETHQTEDGVVVPEVLRPYMAGKDFLPFVRGPPELTKGEKGKLKK